MVHAAELTPAAPVKALEVGNFYATTGVTLKSVRFKGNELTVEDTGFYQLIVVCFFRAGAEWHEWHGLGWKCPGIFSRAGQDGEFTHS